MGRKDSARIWGGLPIWTAEGVRKKGRIHNAEFVILVEKGLFVGCPYLQVVDAFHVRDIRTKAGIGQGPVLTHGLGLKTSGSEIGKWVGAGVIVILIAPNKGAQSEHGCVVKQSRP